MGQVLKNTIVRIRCYLTVGQSAIEASQQPELVRAAVPTALPYGLDLARIVGTARIAHLHGTNLQRPIGRSNGRYITIGSAIGQAGGFDLHEKATSG